MYVQITGRFSRTFEGAGHVPRTITCTSPV